MGSEWAAGLLWKLAACLCFVWVQSLSKGLMQSGLPIEQILGAEMAGALCIGACLWQAHLRCFFRVKPPYWDWARVLVGAIGLFCYYRTLRNMPLVEAVSTYFLGQILSLCLARCFLKERLSKSQWGLVFSSFAGVFLVLFGKLKAFYISPSLGFQETWIWALSAALCLAVSKMLTRLLGAYQRPERTSMQLFFGATLLFLPMAMSHWVRPNFWQGMGLFLTGVSTCLAHYCFARAYQLAPVSLLVPVNFSKLCFAWVFDRCLFNVQPKHGSFYVGLLILLLCNGFLFKVTLKNQIKDNNESL